MYGHPDQKLGSHFYSQWGQDVFILNLLKKLEFTPEDCFYLDLGAHHPSNISNTALLSDQGYRGTNVEANPELIRAFHEQRTQDLNLNVGIALKKGIGTFYMLSPTSGLNSFVEGNIERHEGFKMQSMIELPVTTLDDILEKHRARFRKNPEILLTDLEGLDLEILKVLIPMDRKECPEIICSEIRPEKRKEAIVLMSQKGYYLSACLGEDLIFFKLEHLKKVYG